MIISHVSKRGLILVLLFLSLSRFGHSSFGYRIASHEDEHRSPREHRYLRFMDTEPVLSRAELEDERLLEIDRGLASFPYEIAPRKNIAFTNSIPLAPSPVRTAPWNEPVWTAPPSPWTSRPSNSPTKKPTCAPTDCPTKRPTCAPTDCPTQKPTCAPSKYPTRCPTTYPTRCPTTYPTKYPTRKPTPRYTIRAAYHTAIPYCSSPSLYRHP